MESMRDTAWVLTHALVNMTNACLSSSFLRTDRAFESRFGPVAKWPFCIQTRFRKDPQFWHFCLVAKNALFFTPFSETRFCKEPVSPPCLVMFYGNFSKETI
jgi:hypothetical protein